MSWTCRRCTFVNPPYSKPTCQICLSPSSSLLPPSESPNPEIPQWSCKACTSLNPYNLPNCQQCGTRAPVLTVTQFHEPEATTLNDDSCSPVGSVFFPLRRCRSKINDQTDGAPDRTEAGGFRGFPSSNVTVNKSEDINGPSNKGFFNILSYNVWFREDLEVNKRMEALGCLIELHSPDVICFQEVTPNIYNIFEQSGWWKEYQCSVPSDVAGSRAYYCMQLSKLPVKSFSCRAFEKTVMGRELCIAELEPPSSTDPLVIATTHLESPCPAPPRWDQMYSKERKHQAGEAIGWLRSQNVIFGGDMNWDDGLDGPFPVTDGWVDAWPSLRPGDPGWTYDTKSNQMLACNRALRRRLDRFFCKLQDFELRAIDMIGKEAIPGLSYTREKKVRNGVKMMNLPVLPSDHYGLLLRVVQKARK